MTAAPAPNTGTEIAPRPRSFWEPTEEDLATLKNHVCADLDEQEFKLFLYVCRARGLNPLLRQIYAVKYPGWGNNPPKVSHITSIEGFLLIAERTGEYEGHELEMLYDKKGNAIARCTVFRRGRRPTMVECDYWEFCQTTRDKKGGDVPVKMWRKMPKWMLGKVALARALDRAFPEELGGLYTSDEMPPAQPEVVEQVPREVQVEQARERQQGLPAPEAQKEELQAAQLQPEARMQHHSAVSARDETNPEPDEWKPELPEHGHVAYQAWLTELSRGSNARKLIGSQRLPYLKQYLGKYGKLISDEEHGAVSLVIEEMARQYAKQKNADIKLKVEKQLDEAFSGMPEYETEFNPELYTRLGKTKVIGGKHKGLGFEQLDTDYLDGHLEANRGNFGDDQYEHALTQYVSFRKLAEKQQSDGYQNDDIPAAYTGATTVSTGEAQ